jgi:deoxyadenosine/deoxycytidine kinase
MNVVIDGNIGCGKSTVLEALKNVNNDLFKVVSEDIQSWKPYLEQFYQNMDKYALSFQMKVLLHHINNKLGKYENLNILERSPLSCIHIFGQNLLNSNIISNLDMQLMKDYNNQFGWIPNIVIYIKTDPEICQSRINVRHRNGEDGIPLEYLKSIDKLYNEMYIDNKVNELYNKNINIIVIDGNEDKDTVYNNIYNEMMKMYNSFFEKEISF